MTDMTHDQSREADLFPQGTGGLPEARATDVLTLTDGDVMPLHIGPTSKTIAGTPLRMLAYNGSIPGPLLRVRQDTTVTVDVTNEAGLDQTVHWHGLRLDNQFDGVPYDTQQPIPTGGRYRCQLRFPDPGLYWYHPHFREDYGQEMGLYGQIVVDPVSTSYWPQVNRDIPLTLDDLLLDDGQIPAFRRSGPTHTMMGRFGTVLLVNGELDAHFAVTRGEVVRLYLTNTANARVFNVAMNGATMKLVGGDSGRYEREEFVDSVLLSPSERAILDVLFEESGAAVLEHRTPNHSSRLATFTVTEGTASPSFTETFHKLRTDPELEAERAALAAQRYRSPDKTLQFVGEMDMSGMDMGAMDMGERHDGEAAQMHGQEMEQAPSHSDLTGSDDGIEWEDTMPEMNVMSNRSNMVWKVVDTATGAANHEIYWKLQLGERVKIRLDNAVGSDHQMHHPFHIHGAGRFLVLDRGGVPESNLVWKDTVLVRAGEVVQILFEATNPGRWMAHCHIAEHIESEMMFSFDVVASARPTAR